MKKSVTALFMMLTGVFGGLNVSAADEVKDLTADMFYTWDGTYADASKLSEATVDFKIGEELGAGSVVCGTSTVSCNIYADITGSTKIIIKGTVGLVPRVLINRHNSVDPSDGIELNPKINDEGIGELDLTEYEYVHINAIKIPWSGGGEITAIQYVKPGDPLELPKEQLKNEISTAKMYNSIAVTEESFASLQEAISAGETAATAADATVESLEAAKNAISDAIAGLELAKGYSELTAAMFKEYASLEEPGEGTETGCAYELFKETDLSYGDGSVNYLKWADLSDYDKLIIAVKQGTPRFCMNRMTGDGQQAAAQADSKMLDINPNNGDPWSTEAYQTVNDDKTVFTIDLKKIVEGEGEIKGYGYAHLNCIKSQWGPKTIVTGMYLFKDTKSAVSTIESVESSVLYNVFGQQVDENYRGIVIKNGKKILKK